MTHTFGREHKYWRETWEITKYRMRVYKPGDCLWQTHDIHADNDATAKCLAQLKFDELAAELANQEHPKIADPTLERFGLYDGDRLVYENVDRRNLQREK